MASLKDDHSWRCGICRVERLVGRRTQAALTAGILAVASVAPSAAFAQQGGGNGSAVSDTAPADFDLGGGSDDLAEETAGEPAVDVSAPTEDDAPPAAEVPKTDPAVPVSEEEASEAPDVPETPATEPVEVSAPSPASAPPAPVATAEPAPPLEAESAPEAEDVVEPRPAKRSKTQRSRKARTTPRVVPAAPPTALPAPVHPTRFRNGSPATLPAREKLSTDESAAAAAQLILEIETLPEETLQSRAIGILKAKNGLSADDAKRVEDAFASRMALPGSLPEALTVQEPTTASTDPSTPVPRLAIQRTNGSR